MKTVNIMALRGKINDVAKRVWIRMRLFDPLFYTICVLKHVINFINISIIDNRDQKENFAIAVRIEILQFLKREYFFLDYRYFKEKNTVFQGVAQLAPVSPTT